MERVKSWVIAVLLVALLAGGVYAYELRSQAYAARVEALNAHARADSSEQALRHDGDSLVNVAEREVEQKDVALQGALAGQKWWKGQAQIAVTVARTAIERTTPGAVPVVRGDTVQFATMLPDSGVTIEVEVRAAPLAAVPPGGPISSSWQWHVRYEPMALRIGLACARDTAVAEVVGPAWSNLHVVHAEQRASFCNPPPQWHPFSLQLPSLPVAGALFGIGVIVGEAIKR